MELIYPYDIPNIFTTVLVRATYIAGFSIRNVKLTNNNHSKIIVFTCK